MTPDRLRRALQLGVLALLLLAPLPYGSVQPGAVLAIELTAGALGLLTILLIAKDKDDDAAGAVPRFPLAICAGVAALGILQLLPLPFAIAEKFNPTADLVRPLIPYLGLDRPPSVTWSVASPETTDALLRFVAYVLIGLAAAVAFDTERSRRRFAVALVTSAVFQAIYGSGEYLTGRQHIFGFAKKYYLESATGTFINRNHFATLLAIALPFALTLAIPRGALRDVHGWRERLVALSKGPALLRLFAVAASALVWMGLLLSHSRAGLVAGIVAAVVVLVRFRATAAARWAAAIGAGVLLILLTIETAQAPGERFLTLKGDISDKAGRPVVWRDAMGLVAARPVAGWGFGTFGSVFPTVQSADIDVYYDHAHNDWLEWTTEGGVLALAAGALLLAAALRGGDTATRAALSAVALHAGWDFSLRIPAVAVATAATMGLAYSAYAAATASRSPSMLRRAASGRAPVLLAFLLACAGTMPARAADPTSGLGGWIVPWDFEAGMRSVASARGRFDDVFLFAARFDRVGRIVLDERKGRWPDAVRDARAAGARVWLTVVNDVVDSGSSGPVLKDQELVREILASRERAAAHRADIASVASQLGVDGVDLDYENLPAGERDRFSSFVRTLAEELHARGLALSVTVQPKTGESTSRGPAAMDWSALCAAADRIQVMLYNQHNASTGPGPIAGIDWVRRVADYGLSVCPARALVPVLKVSGMDWGPGRAEWLSFSEASSIIARVRPRLRRERESRVPWFVYRAADGRHVVYFEDAESLAAKAGVLRARGLSRIVLWSLGSEDPETALKTGSRTRR